MEESANAEVVEEKKMVFIENDEITAADDVNLRTEIFDIKYENEKEPPISHARYVHDGMTIDELMGKPRPNDDEAFVIIQDGGTGDAICASAMIESAKKFYVGKKIIVGSSHHDVLINNPNIDQLYALGSPGDLFEKWVKPLKHYGSVVKRDIYNACAHKLFPGPLSMIWCHFYGVPYLGDNIKMFLTEAEDNEAKDFLKTFPRPVIVIHPSGGRLTWNGNQITPNKDWFIEYWAEVVKDLIRDYDVVQMGGPEEEGIPNITTYIMGRTSMRQTAALLKNCLTWIGIDSLANHMGPSVGKPGVALFGRSNPYIAGHAMNKNLWVEGSCPFDDMHCGRPQGYFGDSELFRGVSRPWVCPGRPCMTAIRPSMVIKEVRKLIKEIKKN